MARALGLTRRAIEAALTGDMLAMKRCLERVLPRCQERPVTFSLPSLAAVGNGEIDEPSPQDAFARDECSHDRARVRRDHAGRGDNDRRGLRDLSSAATCCRS
jgi:hypothetical protein